MKNKLITRNLMLLIMLLFTLMTSYNGLAKDVSGTVSGTWTTNNSPYRVTNNIQVAVLTINPGVTVVFAGNYVFQVAGVLKANGTPTAPIVFMGTNGGWQGIYFNNSSPGSVLAYCTVSNSVNSGIRIINSSPAIKSCFITSNSSGSSIYGGGIYVNNASVNLTITDTTIANNKSNINPAFNPYNVSYGGGIYAIMNTNTLEMSGCVVTNNISNGNYGYGWAYGGGVSIYNGKVKLNWCVISENSCIAQTEGGVTGGAAWGGGIFSSGNITLNNCLLKNNTASSPDTGTGDEYAYGGAIYIWPGSSVAMTNCVVQANAASAPDGSAGGGICVGGGLYDHTGQYMGGGGSLNVVNCTIGYDNLAGLAISSGATVNVLNAIVYFNASGGTQITGVSGSTGTPNVTYSDVQGGFTGVGNINLNPIFYSTDNLIIVPGSPCVDKGNTNIIYNDAWFPPSLGNSLATKFRNDMGAQGGPGAGAKMTLQTWPQVEVKCFGGVPGYNYEIDASTNLVNWQALQQYQINNLGDVMDYLETNNLPFRCYKLNVLP